MKHARYLLLIITAMCTVGLVRAETAAEKTPIPPGGYHIFTLNGVERATYIDEAAVTASPQWDLDKAPPISFKRVIEITRLELGKLVKDEAAWTADQITLNRVNRAIPEKWYYDVLFHPPFDPRTHTPLSNAGHSINLLVDFSGNPGKILLDYRR
jgi:hypothetical protein